jgi:hypothetical protein
VAGIIVTGTTSSVYPTSVGHLVGEHEWLLWTHGDKTLSKDKTRGQDVGTIGRWATQDKQFTIRSRGKWVVNRSCVDDGRHKHEEGG